jgi:hypothetical protein
MGILAFSKNLQKHHMAQWQKPKRPSNTCSRYIAVMAKTWTDNRKQRKKAADNEKGPEQTGPLSIFSTQ